MGYLLAIDQGTTGSTALIVEESSLKVVAKQNVEFKQIYPAEGYVEHDLNDILSSVEESVKRALAEAKISSKDLISIGITNQRETTCAFSKDGSPLANAIVWQDRRTHPMCEKLSSAYESLRKKTGLPLDPYFSGTKMKWLLENNDAVKKAADARDLCFGTIDTFLLYRLTDGTSFKTEPSNASRTLLMDLDSTHWDSELLKFFSIKESFLPQIQDSFSDFGKTKNCPFIADGVSIHCILGDQQAALFGQAGTDKGDVKCTYGTGAFILLNTGKEKVFSENGLLTTVAFRHKGQPSYALEGSSYIAGAAVQWLRDEVQMIESSSEVEGLATEAPESEMNSVLLFPFFTGIGTPYWNSKAKASLVGLARNTGRAHIARATLEGIALSINDSFAVLEKDSPAQFDSVRVDGGASNNNFLMQIQANFSGKKMIRPTVVETTAFGVILGSLVYLEKLEMDSLKAKLSVDREFDPEARVYFKNKSKLWSQHIHRTYLDQ